jgi:hypothetical protein
MRAIISDSAIWRPIHVLLGTTLAAVATAFGQTAHAQPTYELVVHPDATVSIDNVSDREWRVECYIISSITGVLL